ncbi:hypothetical protein V6N13_032873 [Hibiscus sabdariffa]
MKSNRGRKFLRKGEFKNKNREEEKDQLICYECKKTGHIRTECPQLKKKSFDEEEVANLCLMALDDEPKVTSNSSLCDLSYNELFETYEELQEVYDELVEKYKESILKNKKIISDLKNDKDSLYEANHNLELKIKSMQEDQKVLEKKNQDLHGLLSKVQEDHQKEVGDLKASLNKGEHCYKAKASSANSWYLDSGCSRHMTGDKSRFLEFKSKSGGVVTFGDNSKGNIEGIGSIGNHSSILIDDVLYVNGLKHNLLSISQLCDKGFNVFFESNGCKIINIETNQVVLVGHRIGNIYMVHLDDIFVSNACFVASNEHDAWLWHRKLGHASMSVLEKLISKNLVRGLPKIKFSNDKICDACAKGKQHRTSFKSINDVSTSRVMQLIHMDLFGPIRTISLGGK